MALAASSSAVHTDYDLTDARSATVTQDHLHTLRGEDELLGLHYVIFGLLCKIKTLCFI